MASTVLDPPPRPASGGWSTVSPPPTTPSPALVERDRGRPATAADERPLLTFLMTDMVASTELAAALGDDAWGELLLRHHAAVRAQLRHHRGHEVTTRGDGFFAVFDSPAAAVVCAHGILAALRDEGVKARAGLHRGSCAVVEGIPAGVAVHVTARITDRARAGQVLVSQAVVDRVADPAVIFEEPSLHHLKGVPAPWWLYPAAPVPDRRTAAPEWTVGSRWRTRP